MRVSVKLSQRFLTIFIGSEISALIHDSCGFCTLEEEAEVRGEKRKRDEEDEGEDDEDDD